MKKTIFSFFFLALFFSACEEETLSENIVAKPSAVKKEEFKEISYTLKTVDAKTIEFKSTPKGFNFKDYKGKKAVLIDVFASWCPPCIAEIPVLNELREKYKNDFEIVSVLFEKDKPLDEVMAFIQKHKIKYPVTVGKENFVLTEDLGKIRKVPEMFLFSKKGEFVNKFIGKTSKEELEKFIKIAVEN